MGETPLFSAEEMERLARGSQPNPMVRAYGPGPEGRTCFSCCMLHPQSGVAGRYLKCDLRPNTRGPSTDHKARWQACSKFEAVTP